MSKRVSATINLAAVSHNIEVVKSKAPNSQILAMVKADAYGHGAGEIARVVEDKVSGFGVATLEEAAALRDMGISIPIVLLEGFNFSHELAIAKEYGLELVIHNLDQLSTLLNDGCDGIPRLWLKLDTGMHRLGFSADEWQAARLLLEQLDLPIEKIVMTHLACADELNHPQTDHQVKSFENLTKDLSYPRSIANSAVILSLPDLHQNWVRPGIMLYGVSPFGAKKRI